MATSKEVQGIVPRTHDRVVRSQASPLMLESDKAIRTNCLTSRNRRRQDRASKDRYIMSHPVQTAGRSLPLNRSHRTPLIHIVVAATKDCKNCPLASMERGDWSLSRWRGRKNTPESGGHVSHLQPAFRPSTVEEVDHGGVDFVMIDDIVAVHEPRCLKQCLRCKSVRATSQYLHISSCLVYS